MTTTTQPSETDLPLPSTGQGASHFAPLTVPVTAFILVQLGALALAVLRVPLMAKYPVASERLAAYFVLAAQVAAISAMFPLLARNWRTAVAVGAAGAPLLVLGCALSSIPPAHGLAAGLFVAAWLAGLTLVAHALCGRRTLLLISAAMAGGVLAGPFLWYLALDFHPASVPGRWPDPAGFGPIPSVLEVAATGWRYGPHWWWAIGALLLGAAMITIRWRFRQAVTPRSRV